MLEDILLSIGMPTVCRGKSGRRRFLALVLAAGALPLFPASAQQSGAAPPPDEEVIVTQRRLLQKDVDIAGATSELTASDVAAANTAQGSLETLLTMTPSVTGYSNSVGQNAETLAIRGERELEISQTINGMPMTGLFSGAGAAPGPGFSNGNLGGPLTLNEIAAVEVYPGVAPPDKQGFGTVGGTIAYTTKEATDQRYLLFNAGFGSFSTHHEGFEANSGRLFADDPDAPKMLLFYDRSDTDGFVKNTKAQYNNVLFNAIKPYDSGLSKVELTVIDNSVHGYVDNQPTPLFLIDRYGYDANFPLSEGFQSDRSNFLTAIARNETAISDRLFFDVSLLFQNTLFRNVGFNNPNTIGPGSPYPYGIEANIFNPYFFYGAAGNLPNFTYDPAAKFGSAIAGLSSEVVAGHQQSVEIEPKLSYFWETDWASQEFTLGLFAGRSYQSSATYAYGTPNMPEICGYNAISCGGFNQRSVLSGFFQDKIDLFDNTLHLQPGMRIETAYTSVHNQNTTLTYNPYVLTNYTKQGEPYIGVSYDLPAHVTAYASAGIGSLFAPTSDYYIGSSGTTGAPNPEKVYSYQAGLRYNTADLLLSAGWYYQQVKGAFSFFEDYIINEFVAGNTAEQQFRGLEFAAKYKIDPVWTISGNGSYNQAQYLSNAFALVTISEDQYGYEFKGANLSNVPHKLANLSLQYDDGVFLGRLSGQYTGSSSTTGDLLGPAYCGNPSLAAYAAGTYNPGNYPLCSATTTVPAKNKAYGLVNLLFSYKLAVDSSSLKGATLSLNVQNLLDHHYYSYLYSTENALGGLYGIQPSFQNALIGPPRSVMADLSVRF